MPSWGGTGQDKRLLLSVRIVSIDIAPAISDYRVKRKHRLPFEKPMFSFDKA